MQAQVLDHPSTEELEAFALGQLPESSVMEVESHLALCGVCRGAVDAAPAGQFVDIVQQAFADADVSSRETAEDAHARTKTMPPGRPVPVSPAIPDELADHPRYRLQELLGAGGMGAVFKAEHLLLKRTVAVKVVHRALFTVEDAADRFGREMEAVGKLTHPNIVHAYDAEAIGNTHFLAMEFVEGVSLAKHLAQRGPLPIAEACGYVRQAALGLQHAHEQGMVHRDIKPQNLMLTADGRVKILDFGLARFVLETTPAPVVENGVAANAADTSVEQLTHLGTIMGTPAYLAPEQARDPHSADIRADIFSLGCTLFDLLSGPVAAPSPAPVTPFRSLLTLRSDVPHALAQILEKMLAYDPARRFQTPDEVADALKSWAESGATRARPTQDLASGVEVRNRASEGRLKPVLQRMPTLATTMLVLGLLAIGTLFVPAARNWAAMVVRVVTNKGVLVIEAEDQDVEITIRRDGTDQVVTVQVSKAKQEAIELRAGDFTIEASLPGGVALKTTELTLLRGGKKFLSARMLLPRQVLVSRPIERQVNDAEEFIGKAEALTVNVIPRLSGYLQKINFREGELVKEGQVLFEIDPRPTITLLNAALTWAQTYESQLKENTAKPRELVSANLKAVKEEINRLKELLTFTKITSLINGRAGRLYVTTGNFVKANETKLTTIVDEDHLFVYFDVPDATLARIRKLPNPKPELELWLKGKMDTSHKVVADWENKVPFEGKSMKVRPSCESVVSRREFSIKLRLRRACPSAARTYPQRALNQAAGHFRGEPVSTGFCGRRRFEEPGSSPPGDLGPAIRWPERGERFATI